jgi:flagellar motor switch protein FliN/FliY
MLTRCRNRVSITTPELRLVTPAQLQEEYPQPCVIVTVRYTDGLSGSSLLVIKQHDAAVIADLMMGGSGTDVDPGLDELKLSAVGEAMNQMMGTATTSLSSMFHRRIDIAPPALTMSGAGGEGMSAALGGQPQAVQIRFRMEIEGLVDSEIMMLLPIEPARQMAATLMGTMPEVDEIVAGVPGLPPDLLQPSPPPADSLLQSFAAPTPPRNPEGPPMGASWQPPPSFDNGDAVRNGPVSVQPVQFAPLVPEAGVPEPQNIGLIMDVPLDISVELGRTRKTIKEVLELGPGSIIQLEKMAGEPVDLLVNGKLIAKGEVVVIDENYGVRVTAIISPMDRMSKLQ